MSDSIEFAFPWVLLLLPLALLPLVRRQQDAVEYSWINWLPPDRLGQVMGLLWQAFAVLAILACILALAGPGRPQSEVLRIGHGAEILVLMDRSRSMDERMLPSDWRSIDPLSRLAHTSRGVQKSTAARELLAQFVAQRPNDRFSLMFFSTKPLDVVSFTQHDAVVQAGITAGGISRGLSDTNVGRALLAGIAKFDGRKYTGSRIILLVSDGGAHLDQATRRRIADGLARNRIALYWFYLRSYNSPTLSAPAPQPTDGIAPEAALHEFFQSLSTPYQVFEADVPEDLARAVEHVGRQQNLPLEYYERIPRRDYTHYFIGVAAFACLMLLAFHLLLRRSWL